MPAPTSPAREAIRGTVPKLAEISDTLIYGEVWERPGLSKRDRSLITVASLLALGRDKQLEGHLARALANGVTKDEISELPAGVEGEVGDQRTCSRRGDELRRCNPAYLPGFYIPDRVDY